MAFQKVGAMLGWPPAKHHLDGARKGRSLHTPGIAICLPGLRLACTEGTMDTRVTLLCYGLYVMSLGFVEAS
jgi:hypothetical protein